MKELLSPKASIWMFIILFTSACIILSSAQAFSADQNIAKLTKFTGKVMIKSKGAWGIKPKRNLPLYSGDKVATRIGTATITFNDGAVMEVRGNSNLMIMEREEEEGIGKKVKVVKRRLRLLLGKLIFRTGRAKVKTSLETTTAVCGIRGTAGTLSIGVGGQSYLNFTEGGVSFTVGDFIADVAADVPTELADLNPAQRAAYVAQAAAEQAAQAAERAASGEITEVDAALAGALAAEAAGREALAAAQAMLDNPDPEIQAEAAAAIVVAQEAIEAAQEAQQQAIENGADPDNVEGYEPPEGEAGFDVDAGEMFAETPQGLETDILIDFMTDITPPEITVLATANEQDTTTILISLNEAGSFTYILTDAAGNTVAQGLSTMWALDDSLRISDDGSYILTITATDEAENPSSITKEFTLKQYLLEEGLVSGTGSVITGTASGSVSATQGDIDGGWHIGMGGTYTGTHSSPWTMNAGGEMPNGYWLETINSAAWLEEISDKNGISDFRYLTETNLGQGTGVVSAIFEGGDWSATDQGTGSLTETPLAWSARADGKYHYYDDYSYKITPNYDLHGILGTTISPFTTATALDQPGTSVDLHLMGEAWPDELISWWAELQGSYAGDGSVIPDGFIGGRTASHEGMLVSLYVNGHDAGILLSVDKNGLFSNFNGSYYPLQGGMGMFEATGLLQATKKAAGFDTYETKTNFIDGNLSGSFSSGGEIWSEGTLQNIANGYLGSYTAWLRTDGDDEPWGIYNIELGGYYEGTPSNDWSLYLVGPEWRGLEETFWLAMVTGTDWSGSEGDERIAGTLDGRYFTPTVMGTIGGNVLGSFHDTGESGLWEAIALGTFSEQELAFAGEWLSSLLYNDDGEINWSGWPDGFFGLAERDGGDYDLLALGQYWDWGYGGGSYGGPYVWSGSLYGEGRGIGAGGIVGFTAGSWKQESPGAMDGYAAAIYYTGDRRVGLLIGGVLGNFYEIFDVGYGGWITEGILTNVEKTIDLPEAYDPATAEVDNNYLEATLSGSFGGSTEKTIYGDYYNGKTKFITYDDDGVRSLPWGIYNLKLGDGDNYYWGKPPGDPSWSATIGGWGNFGYGGSDGGYWWANIGSTWYQYKDEDHGTIDGILSGRYLTQTHMGTIGGPFYGLYTEYGVDADGGYGGWVGLSVGTFEGEPLAFAGEWGEEGDCLYYYDNGDLLWAGWDFGLIGGPTSPVQGPAYMLAIGIYADQGPGGPYLWNSRIWGDSIGGGEFFEGFTGGVLKDGTMDGMVVALGYGGSAGILLGDLNGSYSYYETGGYGGGVWIAESTLMPVEMVSENTSDVIVETTIDFHNVGGNIIVEDSEGDSASFDDQDWGIWRSMAGGTYSVLPSDDWSLSLSNSAPGPMGIDRWAEVVGSQWSGGMIAADVAGAWVDLDAAKTGVMGGKLKGIFDPDESIWLAVAMGSVIETNKFLDMVQNNRTALQALNIPCIEVGRANLSGTGGYSGSMNVNMWDTTFFAYSTGATPRIWTSGNVTGNGSTGLQEIGSSVNLKDHPTTPNLTAEFWMKNWSGGKWGADVNNGAGTVGGHPITFKGGAAGTTSGSDFSGTAAGVASPGE